MNLTLKGFFNMVTYFKSHSYSVINRSIRMEQEEERADDSVTEELGVGGTFYFMVIRSMTRQIKILFLSKLPLYIGLLSMNL